MSGRSDPERALLSSPIASTRMRTAVAAAEWKRSGIGNVYWNPESAGNVDYASANVCILPKFYSDSDPEVWRRACRAIKNADRPLVLDVCDYPFRKPRHVQTLYAEALEICDALIVNSERMGELMAQHLPLQPVVIDDAILGPSRNVEFAPAGRLRLLWFGHVTNLRYLDHCMNALVGFAAERPCRLTIVTEDAFGAREVTKAIDTRFSPFLRARFVEWSSKAMTEALRECDLALIPSDPADPSKAGVSANRVAEVLRAGRFPVASPLPAYLPFAEAAWLGHDLIEGVRWALGNHGEVRARVRRGQSLVTEKLSPARIGRQWRELLEDLARAHS